jgi:hypothetical protein
MATREQQAASIARREARRQAIAAIAGQDLPLPTERRNQPATYTEAIPAEVLALGREGLTDAQIADHLGLALEELTALANGHKELKDALSRARTAAVAWYEEKARRAIALDNNRFPAGLFAHIAKVVHPDRHGDRLTVTLDLSQLVRVSLPTPSDLAGLPDEQTGPLIEARPTKGSVQQGECWTAEGTPEAPLIRTDGTGDES